MAGKKERTKRRRHRAQKEICEPTAQAIPAAPAPGTDRFMRFAVAFLIIFVLLWLFAPDPQQER